MSAGANPPDDIEQQLNPHRAEDEARAVEHAADILRHRGVRLEGNETGHQLADLFSAVEQFERAVRARGGDSLLNTPESSSPENPVFVLPRRRADEDVEEYVLRIQHAAGRLGG